MEPDAEFCLDAPECPVYHVTRDQINSTDFLHFVQKVFRSRPDVPMFKIAPPLDWKPTQRRPNLDSMTIQTPIKQLVWTVRTAPRGCYSSSYAALARTLRA